MFLDKSQPRFQPFERLADSGPCLRCRVERVRLGFDRPAGKIGGRVRRLSPEALTLLSDSPGTPHSCIRFADLIMFGRCQAEFCILCIAVASASSAQAAVAGVSRGALWRVIQTCLINHALTGAAFPCLDVNVSEGNERGYAILRPPFAASDLILAPTRKIVGVEDPSLQASDAPNYFEDAWNAHKLLQDTLQKPVARDEIVLAVNSRQARTQDQLHIHIGCLTAAARQTVRAFAPALPESRWVPLGRPFHGLEFWGRLVVQEDLLGVNPFRTRR